MNCKYCDIKNSKGLGKELTGDQWIEVFDILTNDLGVEFNLLLGNEPLTMGDEFVKIVKHLSDKKIHYAVYSTSPKKLFNEYKDKLIEAGLNNYSCGFDSLKRTDSIGIKSKRGFDALIEMRKKGVEDIHLQLTLSKINLDEVIELAELATKNDIWFGVSPLHWNKDGKYDFFPKKEELNDFIIEDREKYYKIIDELKRLTEEGKIKMQIHPKGFDDIKKYALDMSWHCSKPIIITVDSDGSLRLCGYRKGERVPKMTIFDLKDKDKFEEYKRLWKLDCDECPGCFWLYPWQAEFYLEEKERDYGIKVFQEHKSKFYKK
jgi:MoaA/NifB/PqqE/SkfB family radical SAM enzyme